MIIFGWGRQTIKQIGVVFKKLCDHCNNEEYWILTRTITWFTLFFIPVIPYSVKYFLSCPVCKYGFDLNSKQVKEIKPLAEINQLLISGKINEFEYNSRINLLNGEINSDTSQIKVIENRIVPNGNAPLSYCGSCGTSIIKELKFCGNCGTQTSI